MDDVTAKVVRIVTLFECGQDEIAHEELKAIAQKALAAEKQNSLQTESVQNSVEEESDATWKDGRYCVTIHFRDKAQSYWIPTETTADAKEAVKRAAKLAGPNLFRKGRTKVTVRRYKTHFGPFWVRLIDGEVKMWEERLPAVEQNKGSCGSYITTRSLEGDFLSDPNKNWYDVCIQLNNQTYVVRISSEKTTIVDAAKEAVKVIGADNFYETPGVVDVYYNGFKHGPFKIQQTRDIRAFELRGEA